MPETARSPLLRYASAPLAVGVAMLLRWPLWPLLEAELAFLFLWPVVMFCAWYGGLGPGLLATLLAGLGAAFFLLEPRFSFAVDRPADLVGMAVFLSLGVVISFLHERLHFRKRQIEQYAQEVARQRELLSVSLSSIGDGVIATDIEGRVTFLNPSAESLTGWSQKDAQGQPLAKVFSIINEQTRAPLEHPVAKVLREGLVVGLANHTVLIARDGSERPIADSAAPIREGDNITGVILVFHDDTERRRAAKAVAVSEARKAAILETALDGIITIDHEGKVLEFNPAAERIFGYRRTEVIGRDMAELIIPPGLRQSHYTGLAHFLATGEGPVLNTRIELTALRAGGAEFPVELAITHIATEGPGIFTGYVRDITERKEADRRKDEFLAMLAHELRNPLAPIRNSLQVLQASEADRDMVIKAGRMMERQISHMARIIDDLLDVSRILRGRIELRTERLDLGRLAFVVLEDHKPIFDQAGLALEVNLPELPVWVNADATRLTQILTNLLQNAVKFTDRGGKVAVRVEADVRGHKAVLIVTDNGAGIAPAILPRLFEVFTQADRSLDRSKGGLGLGLAVVKGLVELHGGDVLATSRGAGQGAEFVIRLPLQPEPAAVADLRAVPQPTKKRLRILVVEDNLDSAESLRMLLELFGHEVEVALTGPAGVLAAGRWRPDVVLCDIGLPGLDGYGVVRELRRNPDTANATMVAVTGYGTEDDRRRSHEAGFDLHLTKPVDPTALEKVMAQSA
jgi:PAS domain S-box-containing protein